MALIALYQHLPSPYYANKSLKSNSIIGSEGTPILLNHGHKHGKYSTININPINGTILSKLSENVALDFK